MKITDIRHSRIAIVTDSSCCLPISLIEAYSIDIVPLYILHDGQSYRDGIDISAGEVYRIMRQRKNLPTTATPSAYDFLESFKRQALHADYILCITLTSLQSSIFESARLAAEMAKESLPGITIEIVDSRTVAGALGFIVLETARALHNGAAFNQLTTIAQSMMKRVNSVFMLDTLYYLARTGRIAQAAALAGAVLNIKPVVEHSPAIGETTPVGRPRTVHQAIDLMIGIMEERVKNAPLHVLIHHADELEKAEDLKERIDHQFNCAESYITEFTPGMGVHAGPGVLALSFFADIP